MTRRGTSESTRFWQISFLALALIFSGSAIAQEDSAEADDTADIEKIAVTGSRIKRVGIDGPAPVLVIDQVELAERGYTTVFEALQDLTINNGYKFEGAESALFTPDVQTINLRGFGVGTTLTLINGRRLANYPAAYQSNATVFSFGSIPIAAVERIEILATGASAIYGSDAVSGVVNIILRQDIDDTTVNALWGSPTESEGTQGDLRLQLVNGKTYDRGSYTFTAEYINRDAILGRDYKQYDNQQDDYPYATDSNPGVYDRSVLVLDQFKSAFGIYPRYVDPAETTGTGGEAACEGAGGGLIYAFRPGAGNFCSDPNSGAPAVNFQNEKESFSTYFNGQLEIGDKGTELFTDILYYNSNSKSNNQWIFLSEDMLNLTEDDTVGFGFYNWYLVQALWNEQQTGMDLATKFDDQAWTAVVGARGTWGETQDWEVSANYSTATYESAQPWLKWRETIDNMLGAWLGTSFFGDDWWSGGTIPGEDLCYGLGNTENLYSPPSDCFRDAIGTTSYENKSENLYLQFTMNGDLVEMQSGPLAYALVLEYEDETLKYRPDALLQQAPPSTDAYGDPIETGLTGSGWWRLTGYNGDGDRQRWSVGSEFSVPVLANLTVNLAGRYDHYDSGSTSFGGDFTPSANVEYRPISSLLLRAGYTSSFDAPDLAQVFVETGFFTGGTDYINCQEIYEFANGTLEGFDPNDCEATTLFAQRVGAQTFGGEPLDAETGDSYWVGFAWDILDDLSLTVDYTNMSLDQRVIQQSVQGLLNDDYACFIGDEPSNTSCDDIALQIIRVESPATGVSFIQDFFVTSVNQYEEKGQFIDAGLTYNLSTEKGLFQFQADYNNVISHSLKLTPDSEKQNLKSDPIVGGWDFRASFVGAVTWTYEDFGTTFTCIYRGKTTVFNCTSGRNGCVGNVTGENYYETENWWVDSYLTFNWTASYNWTDQWMSRVRVVNVFDEKPPKDDTMDFFDQPWYNIYVYPGAGIGRYAALELEYTF
jgi:outer membrane receptor protein involved in Fe transport